MLKIMKQAKAAFSLLSADEIVKQAELPVHIGLVADGPSAYAEMEEFLAPPTLPRQEWRQRISQVHRASDADVPSNVDIVLYEPGLPCPAGSYTFHRGNTQATCAEILKDKKDLDLALGRQFLPFRRPVVERIIQMVSQENALFAVATALPNVVPNLLELPWAFGEFASDTAFLTANQVRMAFQIAACPTCSNFPGHSANSLPIPPSSPPTRSAWPSRSPPPAVSRLGWAIRRPPC